MKKSILVLLGLILSTTTFAQEYKDINDVFETELQELLAQIKGLRFRLQTFNDYLKFLQIKNIVSDAKPVRPKDLAGNVYAGSCIEEKDPNVAIASALVFTKTKNESLSNQVLVKGLQYTDTKEPERFQKLNKSIIKKLVEKNAQKAIELKETDMGTQSIEKSAVENDATFISTYKKLENVLIKEDKIILSENTTIIQICFFYKK
jgi:hypothetical protein